MSDEEKLEPTIRRSRGANEMDIRRCQATRRGTDQQCKNLAMGGKRVCDLHGGKTPSGIASPHFKDGRSRKMARMPKRYREAFAAALVDKESLATLDAQIAMADAREGELLERLNPQSGTANWRAAQEALESFHASDLEGSLKKLKTIIDEGVQEGQTWDEMYALWETRRRLVDTERRRREGEKVYMTGEQAAFLAANFFMLVRDSGADRKAITNILTGLQRLLPQNEIAAEKQKIDEAIIDVDAIEDETE